jgi:hypothetical protein
MTRSVRRYAAAAAALLVLAGCDGSLPFGLPEPESVVLTAPVTNVFVGESIQLSAVGYNKEGEELPSLDAEWSSSNANVALVTPTGLLTGLAAGRATVRAKLSGKSASVEITVEPSPVALDTVDVGPSTASPSVVTLRVGGTVRFRFGATAGDVTFRPNQTGAPTNIPSTVNALVSRGFFTVGDFVWDNSASPGTTGTIRVR